MSFEQKPPPLPDDYDELEFSIVEEEWNEYTLNDGVTIRGRAILRKIIRNPNKPDKMIFDISPAQWTVWAPPSLRGKPSSDIRDPDFQSKLHKYKVKVTRSHEPWNIYTVIRTGQEVKLKLTIDEINRYTDKFDHKGSPYYNVPHGIAISVKESQPHQGQ